MINHILTNQEGLDQDGVGYLDRPPRFEMPLSLNGIASVSPECQLGLYDINICDSEVIGHILTYLDLQDDPDVQ